MELSDKLNLCIYPMEITWGDISLNLQKLEEALNVIRPQTDLLVLPETFSTGFPSVKDKDLLKSLVLNQRETFKKIKDLSEKHHICIAGSCIVEENERYFNRAFFINPDRQHSFADKKHLFSMAGEHHLFEPGHSRLLTRYKGWNIAMIVCYDVRFPVWCRNVDNEYDLLLAVANWPAVRIKAWERLLSARAIENETYVAGVNCKGVDSQGYVYNGSSCILDYKGDNIGNEEDKFIYGEISLSKLQKFREKFPAWKDADSFRLF